MSVLQSQLHSLPPPETHSSMSLSRAFTTRRARVGSASGDVPKIPQRSITTRATPQNLRHKISAPVQLVHTTNMLSYNAPDLPRKQRSDSVTHKSDSGSDVLTAEDTPPTSPDVSPAEPCGPEPNHLSTYFMAPTKAPSNAPSTPKLVSSSVHMEAPAIPKRSPSHTKKNSYDAIARQRSISQMSRDSDRTLASKASATFSRSSSTSTRASSASHMSTPQKDAPPVPPVAPMASPHHPRTLADSHPFGPELAQVTELAEEYAVRSDVHIIDEDAAYLDQHGLTKLSAQEYLNDVHTLFSTFFEDVKGIPAVSAGPMWI